MILYLFVKQLKQNSLTKDNFIRLNLLEAHNSLFNYDIYLFVKHLNSLTKDNFIRLNLLEAHNSFFNYDIISLCETTKLSY